MSNTQPYRTLKAFSVADCEIKAGPQYPHGILCGFPSVMGNMDLYGDVIFPGAFKECLSRFLAAGFISQDHRWETTALVGFPTLAEERGARLYSEFAFHSDEASQVARAKAQERIAAGKEMGLSIGFSMKPGTWIYFEDGPELLKYAKANGYPMGLFDVKDISECSEACCAIITISELWEYSLTPVPADQQAIAISVKSAGASASVRDIARSGKIDTRTHSRSTTMPATTLIGKKAICGGRGFGLASRDMSWSGSEAQKRVKEKTGANDEPNVAMAKAYVVCRGDKDEFTSYVFPFCDVVDGELKAVPKALVTIAQSLQGARGGAELSDEDRDGAKSFLEAYYAKMRTAFDDDTIVVPWAKDESDKSAEGAIAPRFKGQFLGNYVEHDMCMSAVAQACYSIMDHHSDALRGAGQFKDMGAADCDQCLSDGHDEFKDLCMAVHRAVAANQGAETPEEGVESMKRILMSMLSAGGLGSGLSYDRHAEMVVSTFAAFNERTEEKVDIRKKENREISSANRAQIARVIEQIKGALTEAEDLYARTEPAAVQNAQNAIEVAKFKRDAMRRLAQITLDEAA
jgi:hypothetical protein